MASAGISLAKNIQSLSSYSTRILAHLGMTCKACLFDCFHILLSSSKRSHTCLWLNQPLAGSTLQSNILLVRRQVTQIKFDGLHGTPWRRVAKRSVTGQTGGRLARNCWLIKDTFYTLRLGDWYMKCRSIPLADSCSLSLS